MRSRGVNGTKSRYRELRGVVYDFTEKEFDISGLTISEITLQDAIVADNWVSEWKDSERIATWEWTSMYNEYQSNSGLKRFDLAFKVHSQVCALVMEYRSKLKWY
ncbi:hypothetical protein HQQ94_18670 [Shewanella sp. VB17]|uniref:hypothetical protein n=1 Tax=Shewanella sp. VB17 TaxID=2739432 RepID=UPI0015656890|nr:hypothetical protein [Shewanella sp. VB17]NRD75208.1 hypothetical protein [Shewanella sp. VB17]